MRRRNDTEKDCDVIERVLSIISLVTKTDIQKSVNVFLTKIFLRIIFLSFSERYEFSREYFIAIFRGKTNDNILLRYYYQLC